MVLIKHNFRGIGKMSNARRTIDAQYNDTTFNMVFCGVRARIGRTVETQVKDKVHWAVHRGCVHD